LRQAHAPRSRGAARARRGRRRRPHRSRAVPDHGSARARRLGRRCGILALRPNDRAEEDRVTERQLPRWAELKPLLRVKPLRLDPTERRLADALTIGDLRRVARRRTPRSVFDYTDGAADAELSLHRARRAFRSLELSPSVLHDVSTLDTTTTMLGRPAALPFAFAPTG